MASYGHPSSYKDLHIPSLIWPSALNHHYHQPKDYISRSQRLNIESFHTLHPFIMVTLSYHTVLVLASFLAGNLPFVQGLPTELESRTDPAAASDAQPALADPGAPDCANIGDFTLQKFQDNMIKQPDRDTCLFYTRRTNGETQSLSTTARNYAHNNGLSTIWVCCPEPCLHMEYADKVNRISGPETKALMSAGTICKAKTAGSAAFTRILIRNKPISAPCQMPLPWLVKAMSKSCPMIQLNYQQTGFGTTQSCRPSITNGPMRIRGKSQQSTSLVPIRQMFSLTRKDL